MPGLTYLTDPPPVCVLECVRAQMTQKQQVMECGSCKLPKSTSACVHKQQSHCLCPQAYMEACLQDLADPNRYEGLQFLSACAIALWDAKILKGTQL